jgi:hypothetical protein
MKKLLLIIAIFVLSVSFGFATVLDNTGTNGVKSATATINFNFIPALSICPSTQSFNLTDMVVSSTAYTVNQTVDFSISGAPSHTVYYKIVPVASSSAFSYTCSYTPSSNSSLTLPAVTGSNITSTQQIGFTLQTLTSNTAGSYSITLGVSASYNSF